MVTKREIENNSQLYKDSSFSSRYNINIKTPNNQHEGTYYAII